MTRLYKERRDRMVQAVATEAGDRLSVETPDGGMQLLARCLRKPTTSNRRRGYWRPALSAGQ
jgi:DNA-binding transcriptional MocR family regulator